MRPTQQQRVKRSSEALLAAAVELFAEQGYAATTPAQISERAGYTRGMVRIRYGSKLGLLEAALRNGYEERLLASTGDPERSGKDRALGVIDAMRDLLADDPAFLRAALMINFESISTLRDLDPHVRSWVGQAAAAVQRCLEQGRTDGSVDPTVDPAAEARHALVTVIGLAFLWCQDPDHMDFASALAEWRERAERSWRTAPGG